MRVVLTNKGVVLYPADEDEIDELLALREATTYFVEGARFTEEFKAGFWDGRVPLLKKAGKKPPRWVGPVGLMGDVLKHFPEADVDDKRRWPSELRTIEMDSAVIPGLRDYQQAAVDAIFDPEQDRLVFGKGMIQIATRGGKTVIAAAIICDIGGRTLFLCNSEMLLDQTVRFFKRVLVFDDADRPAGFTGPDVGQWGAGTYEEGWVTVCSVQALTTHLTEPKGTLKRPITDEMRERWEEMNRRCTAMLAAPDVIFFDECHHLEGEYWRRPLTEADSLYKIGLSATIHVDRKGGTHTGTIWLIGATGPIWTHIPPSELIDKGWLCRPRVLIHASPEPDFPVPAKTPWQKAYRLGIVENQPRNAKIAEIAHVEVHDYKARVLVTLQQIKHVDMLSEELRRLGLRFAAVIGKTPSAERRDVLERLQRRDLDVVIGTVFGEAVDVPFLDTVIIADGMQSRVLSLQRLRNLTLVDGSDRPVLEPVLPPPEVRVHDFNDAFHKLLATHGRERRREYQRHEAFVVEKVKGVWS